MRKRDRDREKGNEWEKKRDRDTDRELRKIWMKDNKGDSRTSWEQNNITIVSVSR